MSTESKSHVASRMDEEWPKFWALLESVPQGDFERPGVVDDWCLKELLGHVNFWAEKAAHDLRAAAAGKLDDIELPGSESAVDKWNAREAARGKKMDAGDLLKTVRKSHEDARKAVQELPESALGIIMGNWTVGVRFAEDTYRHYREHAEQIQAWLRDLETSED
jgi:hypothetical protein